MTYPTLISDETQTRADARRMARKLAQIAVSDQPAFAKPASAGEGTPSVRNKLSSDLAERLLALHMIQTHQDVGPKLRLRK